jgi:hypothetical protein
MAKVEKMRMCPFCEGSVPLDAPSCRFCGSAFDEPSSDLNQGLNSENPYYSPPYSPTGGSFGDSVFKRENKESIHSSYQETNEEEEKGHIFALTLLSAGGMLLTLSLLLLFFSEHGRVVLEWKSRYWSLYMIMAVPLFYYGFKKLSKL